MAKRHPEPKLWKAIDASLKSLDDRSLREVIRELYALSPENRALLAMRFGVGDSSALLYEYKDRITAQFFYRRSPRLNGGCDWSLCRRLVREYRRATTTPSAAGGFDRRGTIDLGLHFIEIGIEYTRAVAWDEAHPYDCMVAVAVDLLEILKSEDGQSLVAEFLPRLVALKKETGDIGFGFGDDLAAVAEELARSAAKGAPKKRPRRA